MKHFLVMLVMAGSACAALLFLAGCHSPVPLAKPIYGSSSDACVVQPVVQPVVPSFAPAERGCSGGG